MRTILVAGAMALAFAGQQTSQQTTPDTATPQAIPDAPRPQTRGVGAVAPGRGLAPTPTSGSENTSGALPADPDQPAVGSSLPDAPAQTPEQANEGGAAPELPPAGDGAKVFTVRTGVNFVEVPFTVKDSKGRLVPGLTWRDVKVYENGLRQHMNVFTVDPFPLSIAIVIDQSLPYDTMARVNNSLGALGGVFAPYDEVAVFTYNNGPRLVTDFTNGQSPRLIAAVERSKTGGREPTYYDSGPTSRGINLNDGAQDHINPLTAGGPGSPQGLSQQQAPRETHTLNDAILEAAKATTHAGKGRRRIVYVISDGKEYGSKAKTKDVIKYLQTNKIAVYATLTGDSSLSGIGFLDRIHIPLTVRDNILPVYTDATGGQTYAEYRTKGIETSFAQITEEVRTQYTVGYNTREPFIDGKYRPIAVVVDRPNLTVIAKRGYYPTPADAPPPAVRKAPATR